MLTKLEVLVLTVSEIRAMAATKPRGLCWAIVSHTAAHFDEQWAAYQLKAWGEHRHPGISNAIFVCLIDPDNTTWQELIELGLVPVGIGGKDSPYDEHGRVNEQGDQIYTCAAELVTCGYDPKDKVGHLAYLVDPNKRGLDLLNRHKFFGRLYPDSDVYIHAIASLTEYALRVDRNRVNDVHAAPNDIKDDWATWEDLVRGKLRLPLDLALPDKLPEDSKVAMNMAASIVVNNAFHDMWRYLTRGIAFARCLKQVMRYRVEVRKIYIDGIKPPIRLWRVGPDHPLADNRELARVLRYLGADVTYIRNSKGHIFLGIRDNIWKYVDEEGMDPETDYREEKDLKRTRINIRLGLRNIMIGWRRIEFEDKGDTAKRTDAELTRNVVDGSAIVTPGSKAGFILGWGSTQAGQGGTGSPYPDETLLEVVEKKLTGEIVGTSERQAGTRGPSRRERMERESVVFVEPDEHGRLPAASF